MLENKEIAGITPFDAEITPFDAIVKAHQVLPQAEKESQGREPIQIGEEFVVFDPQTTTSGEWNGLLQLFSDIRLAIGDGKEIPMSFLAIPAWDPIRFAFAPFNKAVSYQVDERDMDITTRERKIQDLPQQYVNYEAPLVMEVANGKFDDLKRQGLVTNDGWNFTAETTDLLRKLNLQLTFAHEGNVDTLESKAATPLSPNIYDYFFPADSGPFPQSERTVHRSNPLQDVGLPICLPQDRGLIEGIKGRFIVVPQQSHTVSSQTSLARSIFNK